MQKSLRSKSSKVYQIESHVLCFLKGSEMEIARIFDIVLVLIGILGIIFGLRKKWYWLVGVCAAILIWELVAFIL